MLNVLKRLIGLLFILPCMTIVIVIWLPAFILFGDRGPAWLFDTFLGNVANWAFAE